MSPQQQLGGDAVDDSRRGCEYRPMCPNLAEYALETFDYDDGTVTRAVCPSCAREHLDLNDDRTLDDVPSLTLSERWSA